MKLLEINLKNKKNMTELIESMKELILQKKSVGSQIVAHTLIETGNGPNKPNTINL